MNAAFPTESHIYTAQVTYVQSIFDALPNTVIELCARACALHSPEFATLEILDDDHSASTADAMKMIRDFCYDDCLIALNLLFAKKYLPNGYWYMNIKLSADAV